MLPAELRAAVLPHPLLPVRLLPGLLLSPDVQCPRLLHDRLLSAETALLSAGLLCARLLRPVRAVALLPFAAAVLQAVRALLPAAVLPRAVLSVAVLSHRTAAAVQSVSVLPSLSVPARLHAHFRLWVRVVLRAISKADMARVDRS